MYLINLKRSRHHMQNIVTTHLAKHMGSLELNLFRDITEGLGSSNSNTCAVYHSLSPNIGCPYIHQVISHDGVGVHISQIESRGGHNVPCLFQTLRKFVYLLFVSPTGNKQVSYICNTQPRF